MQEAADIDPIARLRSTGEVLSKALRTEIISLGSEAVPALIELLEDDSASEEDAPGGGWPPIHAVELLAELKAEEAIEPLLDVLARTDFETIIHDKIALRLPAFGGLALESVLDWLEDDPHDDLYSDLCCVVSELGVRDERIFEHLCELIGFEEGMGAICFANYGDEQALPILRTHIEEFEPNWDSELGMLDLNELVAAYSAIAGKLPDDLNDHVSALWAEWDERTGEASTNAPVKSGPKVGRNDPCPCGSGKKYKKCCQGAQLQ